MLETLRSGRLSLGPTGPRFEELLAEAIGARYCAAVSSGTAGLHLGDAARRRRAGRRGDHVAVLVRRVGELRDLRGRDAGVRRHRPAHVQPRPRGGRGGDHGADEGDRRRRHLRLSVRARPAARALRAARPRARRGRVRGARRAVQGTAARLARPSDDVRVLSEQADDDGRRRRGDDERRGASTSCSSRCGTRAGSRRARGSCTAGSATTTASTTSPPRSASGSSRSSTRSSPRATRGRGAVHASCSPDVDVEPPLADDADHVRSWFVYVVKLPQGVDRDARDRGAWTSAASRPRRTCRRSTSSRTCASATASARGCSPVSEDCSARTLALPFHARLGDDDQEYVVETLRAVRALSRDNRRDGRRRRA